MRRSKGSERGLVLVTSDTEEVSLLLMPACVASRPSSSRMISRRAVLGSVYSGLGLVAPVSIHYADNEVGWSYMASGSSQ